MIIAIVTPIINEMVYVMHVPHTPTRHTTNDVNGGTT
jgi:hypothetical protein